MERSNFIERWGIRFSAWVERWMPDPFLFAIILTFLTFILAYFLTASGFLSLVDYWYKGFWTLLTFGMQMVIILATGYVIANHPRVQNWLKKLSSIPSSGKQAALLVAATSMIFAWINWGLGLVLGAFAAKFTGEAMEEKGVRVHYPVLVAAGYSGLGMIWHFGLSASAPLLSATKGHFLEKLIGIVPVNQTIFSSYGIILSVTSLIFVLMVFYLITPPDSDENLPASLFLKEETPSSVEEEEVATPAEKIERSRVIGGLVALLGIIFIVRYFLKGNGLNLNIVNFTFLMVGILIYLRPIKYLKAFYSAVPSTAGIILQFPFYAGIMGIIRYSGLGDIIAKWLISVSNHALFPVTTWFVAGIVNIFVPSGGGEWAVVGDTIVRAANYLHVPIGKVIMAYAAGDQWTNLFQPFWAIPLLGICQISARKIFGYTIALMLLAIPFYIVMLLIA